MQSFDASNQSWLKIKGKITPKKILTKRLCKAAKEGDVDKIAQLLIQGANPNAKNKNGSTALCFAARFGHLEICTILLDAGALQEANDTGTDPLMFAAAAGHVNIIKLLLAANANVQARNKDNVNALEFAAVNDLTDPAAAQLLLNAGSDIQSSGKFGHFIDIALQKSHEMHMLGRQAFEILVHTLIENGANLDACIAGETLLCRAVHLLHEEACDLLLKSGATIASDNGDYSSLLLHKLPYKAQNFATSERIYSKLIAAGLKTNGTPKQWTYQPLSLIGWQEPNVIQQFVFRPSYDQTNKSRTFILNILFCFKNLKPTLPKDIQLLLLSLLQSHHHHLGVLMVSQKCNGKAIQKVYVPATIDALYRSTIKQLKIAIEYNNQGRDDLFTPRHFKLRKYDPDLFESEHGAKILENIKHRLAQPKLLCNGMCII